MSSPEYMKAYRAKNRDKSRVYMKAWSANNRDKVAFNRQKTAAKAKTEALAAYGTICQCCGEGDIEFLALDHIHGDGAQRRRNGERTGNVLYMRLRKQGWPTGYQVLCHNCNHSKGAGPACSHDNLDGMVMTGAMFNEIWNSALRGT